MNIWLLRHGATVYNDERRYQGRLDAPLSPQGLAALRRADFDPGVVYVSPMLRARQTAAVLFPEAELVEIPDLREMDFGAFEGRNYQELADDPAYRAWVEGGCIDKTPGGESRAVMVGYKNDRYLYFGRAAAKLDDAANLLPSRLAAFLWVAAAGLVGQDMAGAFRIWRRDCRNHASPNSAQCEAACAGALGVELAGPACYFGQFYDKPTIGDPLRPIEAEDILRTNRTMYAASFLALSVGLFLRLLIGAVL